ncbi:MAG TPA: hypothetical protein VD973_10165 [Symbiobacteriaceae bacterium]|nr:hypothetical protein [Symbiobacteriaceae bacterium]
MMTHGSNPSFVSARTGGCGCGGSAAAVRTSSSRASGCGCGGASQTTHRPAAGTCAEGCFERVAYYPGQFLTDKDLNQDQAYQNAKRRMHNRLLHGHGVVCGLEVTQATPGSSLVTVHPGSAIDPEGNEIFVDRETVIDLGPKLRECATRPNGPCGPMPGSQPVGGYVPAPAPGTVPGYPGGGQVPVPQAAKTEAFELKATRPEEMLAAMASLKITSVDDLINRLLETLGPFAVVALRYQEYQAEPQPAFLPQTGCEAPCAYSRIREGWCLEVLCPSELDEAALRELFWADLLEPQLTKTCAGGCACGSTTPYVFLAIATAQRGRVVLNTLYRRRVWSFPQLFQSLATRFGPLPPLLLSALCRTATPPPELEKQTDTNIAAMMMDGQAMLGALPQLVEAQVSQRISSMVAWTNAPVRMMAMGEMSQQGLPLWQQPAMASLVHAAAESLTLSEVDEVSAEMAATLEKRGFTTLAAVLNDPAGVAAAAGDGGTAILTAAEKRFRELAKGAAATAPAVGTAGAAAVETHKELLAQELRVTDTVLSRASSLLRLRMG